MEKTTKKWFIGCGIGCGAIVVILVILLVVGFFFVKNITYKFEETEELANSLIDLYGEVEDYTPPSDGRISYERMEDFLYVRESMESVREKMDQSISIIDSVRKQEGGKDARKRGRGIRAIKAVIGLIPGIGDFYTQRSQALLEVEMGLGEYTYIYILSYYSMLGKRPGDGPDFRLIQNDKEFRFDDWDNKDDLDERNVKMTEMINQLILSMLKNQRPQLDSPTATPGEDEWRGAFLAEIQALESDVLRIPWNEGLPFVIEASFRPFLTRLENSYSSMSNILELTQD